MAELNSQITALLGLGADAMDNMFDVLIEFPKKVDAAMTTGNANLKSDTQKIQTRYALRCQGFDPPKFTLKTYETRYKTIGVMRPASRIDGQRQFTLQFRLDSYYTVYRGLMAWRSLVMQPSTGYASNQLPLDDDNYGHIEVVAIDSPVQESTSGRYAAPGVTSGVLTDTVNMQEGLRWNFSRVWLMNMEDPKFKVGDGNTQSVTATFGFGEYRDPQVYDAESPKGIFSVTL